VRRGAVSIIRRGSTLRYTSAAICGFVAGVAVLDSTIGRHRAISSLR